MSALLLSPANRFWLLLALCLLGFGLLYAVVRDAGRGARRRGLQKRLAALDEPAADAGGTALALEQLKESMAQAQQAMRRAPWASPSAPVPWFLFFGDASANLAGLFATAHAERADAASGAGWWHWWLTRRLVAVEIDAGAAGTPQAHSVWLQSLLALAERRDRLPLNGLVVAVAASDLLDAEATELESLAARTRRLLGEASDGLRLQMPAYLVVTGLERLPGYTTLRGALPPEVLSQALGHRLADLSAFMDTPAGERLDAVFEPLAQQLHALRMSLLREQPGSSGRLAIHEFVEAVRGLQPGLRRFAQVLFENQVKGPRAPRWRGLYLTASASDGTGGAFVHDLFEHFLPVDQPLVRPGRPQ